MPISKVAVSYNMERKTATRMVAEAIGFPSFDDKVVLIKPNFNTADPPPGSTHSDTLVTSVRMVRQSGPRRILVGDRSGPTETRGVFEKKGILRLAAEEGFDCLVFDDLPGDQYVRISPRGSHWRNGFLIAKPVLDADRIICLCCLKTHGFGGHFTMSLKLTTGMIHRQNMRELHMSRHQREMIAEMNCSYSPDLIIMDGVEAFYEGGPMTGERWGANITLASQDRVAIDAVGVAALKMHGTTKEIERRRVFEQDQIRRAVELGLGATGPDEIEILPVDESSEEIAAKLEMILRSS